MKLRALLVMLALLALTLTPVAGSAEARAASGCSARSTAIKFVPAAVPVVLVHGWNGKSENLDAVRSHLKAVYGTRVAVFSFDYMEHNTEWAARPAIAGCLAEYVREVSQVFAQKVTVIAHSMGGLAIRYATDENLASPPLTGAQLRHVVTIDTPHLGSPFGGTIAADALSVLQYLQVHHSFPGSNSDAARCLASREAGGPMPDGCPTPPFLPKGVGLTQISGENYLKRTVFGVELYQFNLFSDGIVPSTSMSGYTQSGNGTAPTGYKLAFREVQCTQTTDAAQRTLSALPPLPTDALAAYLKLLGGMVADSAVVDGLIADKPNLATLSAWLVNYLTSPCSHSKILEHDDTFKAIDEIMNAALADGPAKNAASDQVNVGTLRSNVLSPYTADEEPSLDLLTMCRDRPVGRDNLSLRKASRFIAMFGEEAYGGAGVVVFVSDQAAKRFLAELRAKAKDCPERDQTDLFGRPAKARTRFYEPSGSWDEAVMTALETERLDGVTNEEPFSNTKLVARKGNVIALAYGGSWYTPAGKPEPGDPQYTSLKEDVVTILGRV